MNQSHLRLPPAPRACVMGLKQTRGVMYRSLLHPGAADLWGREKPSCPLNSWESGAMSACPEGNRAGM